MAEGFAYYQRFSPTYPRETCPDVDEAIAALRDAEKILESLRENNSDLRENAGYWRETCEGLCTEIEALGEEIARLKAETAAQDRTIGALEAQLGEQRG
jgi:chromosome segregation ATPase